MSNHFHHSAIYRIHILQVCSLCFYYAVSILCDWGETWTHIVLVNSQRFCISTTQSYIIVNLSGLTWLLWATLPIKLKIRFKKDKRNWTIIYLLSRSTFYFRIINSYFKCHESVSKNHKLITLNILFFSVAPDVAFTPYL